MDLIHGSGFIKGMSLLSVVECCFPSATLMPLKLLEPLFTKASFLLCSFGKLNIVLVCVSIAWDVRCVDIKRPSRVRDYKLI